MTEVKRYSEVQGVRMPTLIYGTAWKEQATPRLTRMAIEAGFQGIDTANQRLHYFEGGVGEALAGALQASVIKRKDLFLQTKFTYATAQDHRLPYDKNAPLAEQVEQSAANSLEHLGVAYLDSYVLHGPAARDGLTDGDRETWRAMEHLHSAGTTRLLGVSNVNLGQLEALCAMASVKPAVVQNRCFASTGWDRSVRAFCNERGILYQGFSLLTANPEVLRHPRVRDIGSGTGRTTAQVVLRFALQVGMTALTGTTSSQHMREDMGVYDFELDDDDVRALETLVV